MTFWKTVGAYLTGWIIAQTFYNRVIAKHLRTATWESEKQDIAEQAGREAAYVIAELFTRGEEYEPPTTHMCAGARRGAR